MNLKPPSRLQQTGTDEPQKPLRRSVFFASIGITVLCTAVLLGLSVANVPTDVFGQWPRVLILLVLVIAVVASLAITKVIPWGARSSREWLQPQVLGALVGLFINASGLTVGFTAVFNPPGATEKTQQEILAALRAAGVVGGEVSLVERRIVGVWGEPGCAVTYQMQWNKRLLTVASKRSVPGQSPLFMQLKALPDVDNRLVAVVMEPLDERGNQHEFLFESHGDREYLTWMVKQQVALKLDRCREAE